MLILDDDVENDETPVVNLTLICLNVAIAFIAFFNGSGGDATWALVPGRFLMEHDARQLATMFSSIFMHWGFLHLIGNMWVLYLFGDNVEDRLGHFTYLLFYLTCGFVAGVIHLLSDPGSMIPSAGASGAIAGVMGAYMVLHPEAGCNTWWGDDSIFLAFRTIKIPAFLIIGVWFVFQLFACAFIPANMSGIAVYAHVGGFLAGLGLLLFIRYREYGRGGPSTRGNVMVLSTVALVCLGVLVCHFAAPGGTGLEHGYAHEAKAPPEPPPIARKQPLADKTTGTSATKHHGKHPIKVRHS